MPNIPSQVLPHDCPLAPPQRTSVYTRTLHRACEVLGGADRLAAQLQVAPRALQRWLDGIVDPPQEVFLACVDIILSPFVMRGNGDGDNHRSS